MLVMSHHLILLEPSSMHQRLLEKLMIPASDISYGVDLMSALYCVEKDGTPVEQASGPNAVSYFVCTELGSGPFTRLPEVRPTQIKVARRLKRFLTGRLDSEASLLLISPSHQTSQSHEHSTTSARLYVRVSVIVSQDVWQNASSSVREGWLPLRLFHSWWKNSMHGAVLCRCGAMLIFVRYECASSPLKSAAGLCLLHETWSSLCGQQSCRCISLVICTCLCGVNTSDNRNISF